MDYDGKLYGFGYNEYKQLGIPDVYVKVPTQISGIDRIRHVSASCDVTLLISEANNVYGCGTNKTGHLGLPDYYITEKFEIIPNICNVIDVAISSEYSYVLTDNNTLYYVGYGKHHKIIFDCQDVIIKISAGGIGIAALTYNGLVYWSKDCPDLDFKLRDDLFDIVEVSVSYECAIALNKHGNVYLWGSFHNFPCEIKISTLILSSLNIIKISAGADHILALDNNGHVYSFGCNESGRLGLGHTNNIDVPMQIPNVNLL